MTKRPIETKLETHEKKESEETNRVIYRIKPLAEEYPYLKRLFEEK